MDFSLIILALAILCAASLIAFALLRRRDGDLQLLADFVLSDVFVQRPRTQPGFVLDVVFDRRRVDETIVAHRTLDRKASRFIS